MKVELPEQVGAAVAAKLRTSHDPDLRAMAKSLDKVLKRPRSLKLSGPELDAAVQCIQAALAVNTSGQEIPRPGFLPKLQAQDARNAKAKLQGMLEREQAAAHAG
jgi:hypothetical protein